MAMTERAWLRCVDPVQMLMDPKCRSPRQRRLAVCACARRVLPQLADARFQKGIEVAERLADGKASDDARHRAAAAVMRAANDFGPGWHAGGIVPAAEAIHWTLGKTFTEMKAALPFAAWARASANQHQPFPDFKAPRKVELLRKQEVKVQCTLVRDIFGNPFRPVAFDPVWRKWHDATVTRLARRVYDERRFDDLPVLADALEEAGCTHASILDHCWGPGPHTRGCWVVDLILTR